ncbi:hypothetical protein EII12_10755 [Buchananella hordeovulneris]|uniref:hypothetical protein n=1 Tax=Buchananella hordeovulneris TaxID=52770 RepID=UPI000F5FB7E8|nr:hypothetical protein [Buchananella hordeovulneris]RRD49213.1 hypothetical protein EII12_10755 [Buchananella hordeovulneris]
MMQLRKVAGPAVLVSILFGLGACTSRPHPTATPTAPTASSATVTASVNSPPTPTPTSTPTQEALGPEGTVIIKEGKIWLVCKDGNYTIDVPEGFYVIDYGPDSEHHKSYVESEVNGDVEVRVNPRLDLRQVPTREKIVKALAGSVTLEWKIRDDLTEFAGNPAITTEFKQIDSSAEPDPNYDGTLLSMFTDIGNTRWVFDFNGYTREEAEALMKQAADSLQKH